jgi:hypothetical protein
MTPRARLVTGLVAFGASAALVGGGALATAAKKDTQIAICHRTGSQSNPYVIIKVKLDSIETNNHLLHHTGEVGPLDSGVWGDIIPAVEGIHDGLNWTKEGKAIYRAGCRPTSPEPESTSTTGTIVATRDTVAVTMPPTTTTEPEPTTTSTTAEPIATSTTMMMVS